MTSELAEFMFAHFNSRVVYEVAGNKKERITRLAKQGDFVRAYRTATTKKDRAKFFMKLWFLNLRSRDVVIGNALFLVTFLPNNFADSLLRGIPSSPQQDMAAESPVTENLPSPMDKWMPGLVKKYVQILKIILNPDGHLHWKDAVLTNSRQALTSLVGFQFFMSLLETVLELIFADKRGRQDRQKLMEVAKQVGIKNVNKMGMDQMRIQVAENLIQIQQEMSAQNK